MIRHSGYCTPYTRVCLEQLAKITVCVKLEDMKHIIQKSAPALLMVLCMTMGACASAKCRKNDTKQKQETAAAEEITVAGLLSFGAEGYCITEHPQSKSRVTVDVLPPEKKSEEYNSLVQYAGKTVVIRAVLVKEHDSWYKTVRFEKIISVR